MARELGDLIVRLSLDTAKFDDGLKRLEASMSKVQASFRSSTTGLTDFDKVVGKLQTSASTLTERLSLQKDKVAQLEKAYAESKRTKGEDAEETQKLAQRLEEARGKLDQTQSALKNVNDQIKLNQNGWYQLGVNLENVGSKLESVGKKMTSIGTKLSTTVTAPIVALGTLAVKAGIDFESAFAGVRKTVDASEEEYRQLSDAIKEMSERIPASTTELSAIMELAGQLGVRGSEHLTKFTETIAALGVSTNLTREDVASMLAQFANITGMDLGNIDKLGSVIVALGNNFATTENDIVRMGQRLAAAGSQLGIRQ